MARHDDIPREVLPIPDRKPVSLTTYDAKDPDTKFPPIRPLRPPAGAPNVLVILLDDVGFGASSAFGGPCQTPTAERLAAAGLKYTRFHTTALCSPTRAAMLSGRNHHAVGMGGITDQSLLHRYQEQGPRAQRRRLGDHLCPIGHAGRANKLAAVTEGCGFSLFIRAYWAQEVVLNGMWTPPAVEKQT